MSDTAQNGKGSKQRPTNTQSFNDNYDRIFCQKSNNKHDQEDNTMFAANSAPHMDYDAARYSWVPAAGGSEKPFEWGDKEYLYMYNTITGEHSYYNATDDVFEHSVEFN